MTDIEKFTLKLKMDATVTIHDATGQATDWIKPGSEVSCTWRGVPTEAELLLQYEALAKVASATLEAVLVSAKVEIDKTRRG
jgi:hypothetical protein